MVPFFVAALLLAPFLVIAVVAGAASPLAVVPALVLALALLFASAAWEWWRDRIPFGWRLAPLALAVLSIWMLATPLASTATSWLVFLTTIIAASVAITELWWRRRDERDRLAR